MTHNPQFIAEMKEKLAAELATLEAELKTVAHKQQGDDYQADFPDYGRNEEDNATEMADFMSATATTEATEKRLEEIKEALRRIAGGTYGVTAEGEAIPEERLRANPAATTIIKG